MSETVSTQTNPALADLMNGFEALTRKVDELVRRNSYLEKQLKGYTQQVSDDLVTRTTRRTSEQVHSTAPTSVSEWRENETFAPGLDAWKKLKEMRGRNVDAEQLERDFTTKGRIGDLSCPFAKRALRRLSKGTAGSPLRPTSLPTPPRIKEECGQDPIAAEFHPDIARSPPASVEDSPPKCPIRFLDDHSPEEVAKYFENHKHEIPRSHEICVKRYQSNEEGIRQLDAKYGNLVNMIQGLGVKHQAMLPVTEDDAVEQRSIEKIEKWAEKCASTLPPTGDDDEKSEIRTGHFERPLPEVRLGESPSRPWGIQVPVEAGTDDSANSNAAQSIAVAAETQADAEPAKRCPFAALATQPTADRSPVGQQTQLPPRSEVAPVAVEEPRKPKPSASQPNLVFNGPVFFGYPAAEIDGILRNLRA